MTAGEHRAEDAAYSSEQPPDGAEAVAGLIAFDGDSLSVFEEVFVHPRDPGTRTEVLRSSRHVRITMMLVAESTRPRMLLGLSCTTTRCPYRGVAHHWSLRTGSRYERDLASAYPEPLHDAEAVRGLLRFPQDRAHVHVDGEAG